LESLGSIIKAERMQRTHFLRNQFGERGVFGPRDGLNSLRDLNVPETVELLITTKLFAHGGKSQPWKVSFRSSILKKGKNAIPTRRRTMGGLGGFTPNIFIPKWKRKERSKGMGTKHSFR